MKQRLGYSRSIFRVADDVGYLENCIGRIFQIVPGCPVDRIYRPAQQLLEFFRIRFRLTLNIHRRTIFLFQLKEGAVSGRPFYWRPPMKALAVVLLLCCSVAGCGGGSISSQSSGTHTVQPASFQGSWEFVAIPAAGSADSESAALIEANLQQANATVTSAQISELYYNKSGWTPPIQPCGAECGTAFSGTVSGSSIVFTLTLNGCDSSPCTFQGSGTLTNGDISGTWTLKDGTETSSGTFTAAPAIQPSGTFTGDLTTCIAPTASSCPNFGKDDASVTFSATELSAVLSGTNNGTFTTALTQSSFVGNFFEVSSPIPNGGYWYGYFDSTGQFTGVKNSIELYAGSQSSDFGMSMGLLQGN